MAVVITSDRDFETEVLDHNGLVLVDFMATRCGPCKMVSPIVEQLGVEYQGKLKTIKLDIDQAQNTTMQYNIMSIPTLQFFYNGEPLGQAIVGVFNDKVYHQAVENALEHIKK